MHFVHIQRWYKKELEVSLCAKCINHKSLTANERSA